MITRSMATLIASTNELLIWEPRSGLCLKPSLSKGLSPPEAGQSLALQEDVFHRTFSKLQILSPR